jgi:hypothetical protein
MTPESLFSILNLIALVGWILLIVQPGRRWVATVTTTAIPAVMAIVYVAVLATMWGSAEGGFSTLAGVAQLFREPWLLLAGWVHYLAFDLIVGSWEARDARERNIPHLVVVPCLILTFLFGPAGWLLYSIVRSTRRPVVGASKDRALQA